MGGTHYPAGRLLGDCEGGHALPSGQAAPWLWRGARTTQRAGCSVTVKGDTHYPTGRLLSDCGGRHARPSGQAARWLWRGTRTTQRAGCSVTVEGDRLLSDCEGGHAPPSGQAAPWLWRETRTTQRAGCSVTVKGDTHYPAGRLLRDCGGGHARPNGQATRRLWRGHAPPSGQAAPWLWREARTTQRAGCSVTVKGGTHDPADTLLGDWRRRVPTTTGNRSVRRATVGCRWRNVPVSNVLLNHRTAGSTVNIMLLKVLTKLATRLRAAKQCLSTWARRPVAGENKNGMIKGYYITSDCANVVHRTLRLIILRTFLANVRMSLLGALRHYRRQRSGTQKRVENHRPKAKIWGFVWHAMVLEKTLFWKMKTLF